MIVASFFPLFTVMPSIYFNHHESIWKVEVGIVNTPLDLDWMGLFVAVSVSVEYQCQSTFCGCYRYFPLFLSLLPHEPAQR